MRRIQCLKYLVLATMLNQSDVDPFDAQVWPAWPAESHSAAAAGNWCQALGRSFTCC